MILRSETGRLVGAAAPELYRVASSSRDADQDASAVSKIQNSSMGWKISAQILWADSGSVVAPF